MLGLSAGLIRGPELPDQAFSNTVSLFIRISPEKNEMNQFKSVQISSIQGKTRVPQVGVFMPDLAISV
ncbi:hypothetical protein SAMN06298226_1898 [Nitrosovibrio sp. Nv4]|nr:hypothetical protein SAMN06298226_1898 [Nitrosovibrio sp. Nv4]